MTETVKIAVIGLGNMGGNYLQIITELPRMELAAVCDTEVEKGKKYAEQFNCPFYDTPKALLEDRCCDAVLIAVPHYHHTTIGIEALEAGCHVLVEKPISVHKADGQRLIDAYRDKSKVFAAMFNQRTDPHFIKIKELIKDGELGEFRRVNWITTDWYRTQHYYNSGSWRATWKGEGGGVLLNQSPHNLDLLQWLCGMPEKITAIGGIGKYHDIEVEDEITAVLEYANGATGVFITTTGEAPGTNRLEVVGTRGKIVVNHPHGIEFTRNLVPTDVHVVEATSDFSKPEVKHVEIPIEGTGDQHRGILKNFADAVLDQADLIAPAVEGLHSVELANAMLYSAITKQPVTLPLDGQVYESFLMELIKSSTFAKKKNKVPGGGDFSQSF